MKKSFKDILKKSIKKLIFFFILSFVILNKVLNFTVFSDAAYGEQLGIQDPGSFSAAGMTFFHNILICYLLLIATSVFWLLYQALNNSYNKENFMHKFIINFHPFKQAMKFSHSSILEFGWTILPTFFLALIALPSFSLLYSLEDVLRKPYVILKVVAHQWYWTYEYSALNLFNIPSLIKTNDFSFNVKNTSNTLSSFDSYMILENDLEIGNFRLLSVDRPVFFYLLVDSLDFM